MTTFLAGSEVGWGLTTCGRLPQKGISLSSNKRDTHDGSAIAGSLLQNGHRDMTSSDAHALEVVDNAVTTNDAAGIAVSGDALTNIGFNADSGTAFSDLQDLVPG